MARVDRRSLSVCIVAATLGIAAAVLQAPVSVAARPVAVIKAFGQNQILNNSFEDDGLGSLDIVHVVKPTAWETAGNATVLQFGGFDGLPLSTSHDVTIPKSLGKNFLAGGPRNTESYAWQHVDLGWAAEKIRRGKVVYVLSAALGGRAGKADFATVWVSFIDASTPQPHEVCFTRGDCRPRGVIPILRVDRNGKTIFRRTACYGIVPRSAATARVSIGAFSFTGADNHAYADDISLELVGQIPKAVSQQCVPSGRDAPVIFEAQSKLIDDASRGCRAKQNGVLAAVFGIIAMLLATLWVRPRTDMRSKRAFRIIRLPIEFPSITGRSLLDSTLTVILGLLVAFLAWLLISRAQTLSDTACALRPNFMPQPWAYQPIMFCVLIAFDFMAAAVVFIHRSIMQRNTLRIAICVGAFELAVVGLKVWTPTSYQLDRVIAFLLIVTLALMYMWLALRDSMQKYPRELRWAIFFTLLLPVLQPVFALWNVHSIVTQRILHEGEHRSFDVAGDRGRFSGVLFYAPTSLDYGESDRVVFSAHLSDARDVPPKSCLVPAFSAPGFRVQPVFDSPVLLVNRNIRWEWVVTSASEGHQALFINVLYNPGCVTRKKSSGDFSNQGVTTLFSQTDSAWVSHRWFSLEDMNSTLPWITLVGVLVALIVGLLDIREHASKARAAEELKEKIISR